MIVRDLPGADTPATLEAALRGASGWGASTLQLASLTWLTPDLDPRLLRHARSMARESGMTLTSGLGMLNAVWPEHSRALSELGDGSILRGVERTLGAAEVAGIHTLHFTIGTLDDRFAAGPDWQEQLTRQAALVAEAARRAETHGITLVLKTHEEMTSHEVVALVESVGSPALGIGFSPVNLLTRLEDPVAGLARVLPHLHTVFIDDAAIVRTPAGFTRLMCAAGDGMLPWPTMLAAAASPQPQPHAPASQPQPRASQFGAPQIVIDLHRAEFDMPYFDQEWSDRNAHIALPELVTLLAASLPAALPALDVSLCHRFAAARAILSFP